MISRLTLGLFALCVFTYAADTFAAAGRTFGKPSVTRNGSAEYSIPIWTPPGVRGIQPKLALVYDNNFGYGLMGPGWTLTGLSVIARCNPTYAQDGTPAPITLTSTDGLCLDGNRLRTAGTATYQTEIANFAQVTSSGTAGNGPSYFTVQGKDGMSYEYGNTTDSKILPGSGVSTPYVWALDKVTDRSGNQMTFTYFQSGGAFVPLTIQYTAPSGSNSFPYKVNFTYSVKSASDTISKFVAGSQIQQTNQLSNITVSSSGTTVREYKLSYTTSSATLRATLTSIQECGGSDGSDCLSATTVGYQGGSAGVATPATPTSSGATNGAVYSVDVDGDGKDDLLFAVASGTSYQWWFQLATATGYNPPVSTGVVTTGTSNFLLDDFDAKGGAEILAPQNNVWTSYKWNGTGFTPTPTGLPVVAGELYSSADVDGDGRPDLIGVTPYTTGGSIPAGTANIAVQLNTSSGSVSFASTPVVTNMNFGAGGYLGLSVYGNNQLQNSSVKHFDFDGDGRQDLLASFTILALGPGGNLATPTITLVPLLSRGSSSPAVGTPVYATITTTPNAFAALNWNDDACTDLVLNGSVKISPCNGSPLIAVGLSAWPSLALDWDGDGRTDLLANVSGTWQVYRSEGSTVAPAVLGGPASAGTWIVTDKDGDGLNDLVLANAASSYQLFYSLHNGANTKPDLANSFMDGYEVSFAPSYVALSAASHSVYAKGSAQEFPQQDYIGPWYVVPQYTASNGIGGNYSVTYSYSLGVKNLEGRGFEGFQAYKTIDSRTSFWTFYDYSTDFPTIGMYTHLFTTQNNTAKYIQGTDYVPTYLTIDNTVHNQRYFPYYSKITDNKDELGGALDAQRVSTSVTTNNSPDNYGNFASTITTLTDNDPTSPYLNDTWTSTQTNAVTADVSTWCLNLPTATSMTNSSTAPGGNAITRVVSYTPDYAKCRQTQKVTEPNSSLYKVTEVLGYDGFGNMNSDLVTGINMTPRTTSITWTTNGQFPATITNSLNQNVNVVFDPNLGTLTSLSDLNYTSANPLKTSWLYDNFGRPTSETRSDGTSTTWAYASCTSCEPLAVLAVTQHILDTSAHLVTTSSFYKDMFDRQIYRSDTLLSGATAWTDVRTYDFLGRIKTQTFPYLTSGSPPGTQTYMYDGLNRVTEVQRPINATNSTLQSTVYGYAGRTSTTTDANMHTTTKITKVTGSLARTQDASGYFINFSHDAFGAITAVTDSQSNTLNSMTYAYGIGAFQITSKDADLGPTTNTYNALGELTNYTDAKGQQFGFGYDALSRLVTRTEPDLSTTWTWGNTATSYNIGQLQSVSAASSAGTYSEAYTYDSKTRPSTQTITIPGDAAYAYTETYNTAGLLNTIKYPVSTSSYQLTLQYSYQNGILQKISDVSVGGPTTVYWTANATNPSGQITQETLGNGVVVNHALDAITGWVTGIQAGLGGGSGLQKNAYLFDEVGNLTQRQDYISGVTENVFPDNLNRLGHTVGDSSTQMTYDALGRVATWEANGATVNSTNYTNAQTGCSYYSDHAQPHAVRSNTQGTFTISYCYDANGNMTAQILGGSTVMSASWTSFDQPNFISSGTNSSQFFYDGNHQRYKQIASYGGAVENTTYVGGLLEKMGNASGTVYRHYIPAGSSTIVYARSSSGANATYYVSKDHLGSSSVITDTTGNSLVQAKFSALGWTETSVPQQTTMAGITRHEFTGHEGLDNLGLVNMNGRIYNPSGTKFLSADPYIPHPSNTQSFGRYSYVNNNPLSLVDPTGFDDDGLDEIVVTAGPVWDFTVDIFGDIGDFLGFGGGGPHLTAMQLSGIAHQIDLERALEGQPSLVSTGDGSFTLASGAGSAVQGPQVLGDPTPNLADPSAIDPNFGSFEPDEEPHPTFAESIATSQANIQSDQAMLDYSKTLTQDTRSFSTLVAQDFARSAPKAGMAAIAIANLFPVVDVIADVGAELFVAKGVAQVTLNREAGNAFRDELADQLSQAGRQVTREVYKKTPFGKRFIDIEVSQDGTVLGGVETKLGTSRYTTLQRLKDWWLTHIEGYPVNVARKP
jgi:RHS repeat-associated protein